MQDKSALGRIMDVVRDLRVRCAWDRVQTRETLRPYLVEEVLELDHAIGERDPGPIRDELGDLLLHLAWQLVLAEEAGEFTPEQLAAGVERKMQRRHPHLFDLGPAEPWERMKRRERAGGVLEGLPTTLPPLLMAFRLQERAASVGFDWPDAVGPLQKVREEADEVAAELDSGRLDLLAEEVGDLLFAVVNLARKVGIEPNGALQRANGKFASRFGAIEAMARDRGIEIESAGLDVLDGLWDQVKGR